MLEEVIDAFINFSMKESVLKQAAHPSERRLCKESIWLSLVNNPFWFFDRNITLKRELIMGASLCKAEP